MRTDRFNHVLSLLRARPPGKHNVQGSKRTPDDSDTPRSKANVAYNGPREKQGKRYTQCGANTGPDEPDAPRLINIGYNAPRGSSLVELCLNSWTDTTLDQLAKMAYGPSRITHRRNPVQIV